MRFVVIGGGCYGTFYARQLLRAADAHAIAQPEIVVVDHAEQPQVLRELADARIVHARADWDVFFDDYMRTLSADADDQIVPPPFTPHLALRWLLARLGTTWSVEPFGSLPVTPFAQQHENGTLNASHADWLCPVHCIEPEICPHTRGERDWDMAETARAFSRTLAAAGQPVDQIHLFQCLHFTHGVGTYKAAAVLQAHERLSNTPLQDGRPVFALVGTVSRCHGTLHLLKGQGGTDTVSPGRALPAATERPRSCR